MINQTIFQANVVPRVLPFLLTSILYRNHLECLILHPFLLIIVNGLVFSLIVTPLLVEVQQYPGKFLLGDRLREGFLAQIINGPVVGYLLVFLQLAVILEILEHFLERVLEKKLIMSRLRLAPSQFALRIGLELTIASKRLGVVRRQKVHDVKHPMQPFPAQQAPFQQVSHAPHTGTLTGLCLRGISFLEISLRRGVQWQYPAASRFYIAQYGLIIVFMTLSFYQSPTYTVGTEVKT